MQWSDYVKTEIKEFKDDTLLKLWVVFLFTDYYLTRMETAVIEAPL